MDQTTLEREPKPVKELPLEKKEAYYARIQDVIDGISTIKQYELKLHVYRTIIKRLRRLGDYKDSKQLIVTYKKLINDCKQDGQEEIYLHIVKMKEEYKTMDDLYWISKEAERITGYKDVDQILAWCEQEKESIQKSQQKRAIIRLIGSVVGIVVIVIVLNVVVQSLRRDNNIEYADLTYEKNCLLAEEPAQLAVEVTLDGERLEESKDFTIEYKKNDRPGTAKAILEGTGKYRGKQELEYQVKGDLSACKVFGIDRATTEEEVRQRLMVIFDHTVLKQGEDFTWSCEDGVVLIKGVGKYSGEQKVPVERLKIK